MTAWRFVPAAVATFYIAFISQYDPPPTLAALIALRVLGALNAIVAIGGFVLCMIEPQKLGRKE